MIDIATHSETDTIALGSVIGRVLKAGDVLALQGDLGAGKTHFVQGIAKGMGIQETVVSPTFTILNYYEHDIPLQLDDLGFDDYLPSGVTVIEWSEKFPDRLPNDAAVITIEKISPTDRVFHMALHDARWDDVEKEVEKYAVSH